MPKVGKHSNLPQEGVAAITIANRNRLHRYQVVPC
jgi:hypothetical protein